VDQRTRDNWLKIKEQLEKAGKTDNYFYVRATIIAKGGKDPFETGPMSHPPESY